MRKNRFTAVLLSAVIAAGTLGCAANESSTQEVTKAQGQASDSAGGGETLVYGDTTFNAENDEADINPHRGYSGWACIRYGIGETLFKYSDTMEPEPWLAKAYETVDENTWKITLRDDVTFSTGRAMDGAAVKECLEDLVAVHARAAEDLKISSIDSDGQTLTITTTEPVPAFIHYISDPYACIIDMEGSDEDTGIVAGTGPYVCTDLETGKGLTLVANENYWDGTPGLDGIQVRTITDGDTMTMALQSGELDAAYGLPYASLSLFEEDPYTISSCETSRTFFAQMNYGQEILQDKNVREAVASLIDKESFVNVLLDGNGAVAEGPFPEGYAFGDDRVEAAPYDPDHAKELLAASGWEDTDGDGYVDKGGEKLTLRWLTYPSRQELPLLAESVQASMKEAGIDIEIISTAAYQNYLDSGEWDIYAGAFVCAPTGDPEYFFTTHCLDSASHNRGGYHSDELEDLEKKMSETFDEDERAELAVRMTQTILDDYAFIFVSHLKMSIVSGDGVRGITAHPCDYYEITKDTEKSS